MSWATSVTWRPTHYLGTGKILFTGHTEHKIPQTSPLQRTWCNTTLVHSYPCLSCVVVTMGKRPDTNYFLIASITNKNVIYAYTPNQFHILWYLPAGHGTVCVIGIVHILHNRIKYPRAPAHATRTGRWKFCQKIHETVSLTEKQGVAVIRGSVLRLDAWCEKKTGTPALPYFNPAHSDLK